LDRARIWEMAMHGDAALGASQSVWGHSEQATQLSGPNLTVPRGYDQTMESRTHYHSARCVRDLQQDTVMDETR